MEVLIFVFVLIAVLITIPLRIVMWLYQGSREERQKAQTEHDSLIKFVDRIELFSVCVDD